VLGHRQRATKWNYLHEDLDQLRRAAERITYDPDPRRSP
jgi:hypothetical protein